MGDGECEEGSIWEMALFAHKYCLDNFTVIVDNNKMQAMGSCEEVIALGSLGEKWGSFGWNVLEVLDGHDHDLLAKCDYCPYREGKRDFFYGRKPCLAL